MEQRNLLIGEDVSQLKIFEIINKFFGQNYTGWMKGWYDINDEFAAWFPTIGETDNKPSDSFGGTQKYSNTLSADRNTIIEINHDVDTQTDYDDPKYDKKRFVFGRINGKFQFLGIFERSKVSGNEKNTYRHERIAAGAELTTFELIMISRTFSVNDSVWVAAAAISYEKYHKDGLRNISDYTLSQKAIRERAMQINGANVEAARTSQWCCGDHENHTYPYLRATNEPNRRLAFAGEFGGREIPENIRKDAKVVTTAGIITVFQLIDFCKSEYKNLVSQSHESRTIEERGEFPKMNKNTNFDKNLILYGPPGTGKTYHTVIYAVAMCENKTIEEIFSEKYEEVKKRYDYLKDDGRIAFTTFHQSYGYEEFIEGIKPVMNGEQTSGDIQYAIEDGVFKKFCKECKGVPFDDAWGKLVADAKSKDNKFTFTRRSGSKVDTQLLDDETFIVKFEGETAARSSFHRSRVKEVYEKYNYVDREKLPNNGNKWVFDVCFAIIDTLVKTYQLSEEVDVETKNRVFIIDEINRGNISKIFGELITLIEDTKRKGMPEAASAILPYSGKEFSVPSNVYILGTMNTADRSIALMDTALRRRFQFVEMMPNSDVLKGITIEDLNISKMLDAINKRIEFLYDREHTIGHAFFMPLKDNPSVECLGDIFAKSVIPLLQEYFYEDYQKIQLVLGDNGKKDEEADLKFIKDTKVLAKDIFVGNVEDVIDLPEKSYSINSAALRNIESYKRIAPGL